MLKTQMLKYIVLPICKHLDRCQFSLFRLWTILGPLGVSKFDIVYTHIYINSCLRSSGELQCSIWHITMKSSSFRRVSMFNRRKSGGKFWFFLIQDLVLHCTDILYTILQNWFLMAIVAQVSGMAHGTIVYLYIKKTIKYHFM